MLTSEDINKRFERDKSIIVDSILSSLKTRPMAILLYGGYGRGEGAWFPDAEGKATPYNDYDVDIVTDEELTGVQKKDLKNKLAERIGIKWIDLDTLKPDTIKTFKTTIQNVDLKEASTLLYGNPGVYDLFPVMRKEDIGEYDVKKLYATRLWTFLGSWEGDFKTLDIEEGRFYNNQMAKAILASCDLFLIAKKQYTPSYKERVQKVVDLYPDNVLLKEYATWALNEKLQPSSDGIKKERMLEIYSAAKRLFCEAMSVSFGQKWYYYSNPDKTNAYCLYHSSLFLRRLYHKIMGHGDVIQKGIDVFCAQNYVFHAWNDGLMVNEYVEKASELLSKWGYCKKEEIDWNKLRSVAAYARNNI